MNSRDSIEFLNLAWLWTTYAKRNTHNHHLKYRTVGLSYDLCSLVSISDWSAITGKSVIVVPGCA